MCESPLSLFIPTQLEKSERVRELPRTTLFRKSRKERRRVSWARNRQRGRVGGGGHDEEMVHASILAAAAISDLHLNGILVYHTDSSHLAVCRMALPRGTNSSGCSNDLLGPCHHRFRGPRHRTFGRLYLRPIPLFVEGAAHR
uniref:Uncharacterized protein n=1 Tax=uncultured marine group II/III euryarchaeote KM3_192_C12 TaxID=1457964 RepID=A0A075GXD2_9EURY|nr:hypothetical protein [uncultured marine group II/III euryarchaeote KM3_192_C12]